eukprot:2292713-Pyramimonas_sp.AAC.1
MYWTVTVLDCYWKKGTPRGLRGTRPRRAGQLRGPASKLAYEVGWANALRLDHPTLSPFVCYICTITVLDCYCTGPFLY